MKRIIETVWRITKRTPASPVEMRRPLRVSTTLVDMARLPTDWPLVLTARAYITVAAANPATAARRPTMTNPTEPVATRMTPGTIQSSNINESMTRPANRAPYEANTGRNSSPPSDSIALFSRVGLEDSVGLVNGAPIATSSLGASSSISACSRSSRSASSSFSAADCAGEEAAGGAG